MKKDHSSNKNSSESDDLKKEIITNSSDEKISSSNEIKKILDEMTLEEKKNDETTMTIPTDLINKYCKKNNNDIEKNVSNNSSEKKENEESKKNDVIEYSKTINEKCESEIKSESEKLETKNLNLENSQKNIANEQNVVDLNSVKSNEDNAEKNDIVENSKNDKKNQEKNESIKHEISEKKSEEKNELIFGDISDNDKKHYGRYFLVFFLILIFLCIIGYLLYVLYSSRNELDKIGNEKNILQEEINNIKNNASTDNQTANGVVFNGYKFSSITNDYSIVDDSLVLKRNDKIYKIQINKNINFESVKSKKETYKQQLISEGYKILSYGNKHVDGNDYYVFIVSDKSMKKYLVAYSKLDNESVIAFIISSNNNNIDYDILSQTNLILSSISKTINDSSNDLKVFIEKK
jgi:hypothetical protein